MADLSGKEKRDLVRKAEALSRDIARLNTKSQTAMNMRDEVGARRFFNEAKAKERERDAVLAKVRRG